MEVCLWCLTFAYLQTRQPYVLRYLQPRRPKSLPGETSEELLLTLALIRQILYLVNCKRCVKQGRESTEVEKRGVAELERSSIGNPLFPSLRSLVHTLAFVDAESVALHVHHASEKPGISLRLFLQARGPAQLVDPFFGLSV